MNRYLKRGYVIFVSAVALTLLTDCPKTDTSSNDDMLMLLALPSGSGDDQSSGSQPVVVGSTAAVTTTRGTTVAASSASAAATQSVGGVPAPQAMQAVLIASVAQLKAAAEPATTNTFTNQTVTLPTTDMACSYFPTATTMGEKAALGVGGYTLQGKLNFTSGSSIVLNGQIDSTMTGDPSGDFASVADIDVSMQSSFTVNFAECGVTAFDVNRLATWDGSFYSIPLASVLVTGDVTYVGTSSQKRQDSATRQSVGSSVTTTFTMTGNYSSSFTSTSTALKAASTLSDLSSAASHSSSLTGSGSGSQTSDTSTTVNTSNATIEQYTVNVVWNTTETVKGTIDAESVEITIPIRMNFSCSSLTDCH